VNHAFEILVFLAALSIGVGLKFASQWSGLYSILAISVLTLSGRRGPGFLLVIALVVGLAAVLALESEALGFILLSVIPGCTAGYLVTRYFSLGKALIAGFSAGAIGFGLFWLNQFYLQGAQLSMHFIETSFVDYFNYIFLPTLEASGLGEYYEAQGLTQSVLKEYINGFLQSLAKLRPGLYILEEWARVLLGIVIGKFFPQRRELLPYPPFSMQRMAWELDWVIIAGLVFWLVGDHWNQALLNRIGANLLFLMTPIAFYFGLSLVFYILKNWRLRSWTLAIIAVVIIFLPVQACMFITVLGIFDPLIDYRNLDGKRGSPT